MKHGIDDIAKDVVLPDRLDLASAPMVARAILERPAEARITVDARAVVHFGTLGVQVLIAAARRARAAGGQFEVRGLSDRAAGQLSALGLSLDIMTEGAT